MTYDNDNSYYCRLRCRHECGGWSLTTSDKFYVFVYEFTDLALLSTAIALGQTPTTFWIGPDEIPATQPPCLRHVLNQTRALLALTPYAHHADVLVQLSVNSVTYITYDIARVEKRSYRSIF